MANASTFDDPGALSGALAGVSFVGGLATGLSLADAPFPLPGADVKAIQRFFIGNAGPERINVTGQLISAASLAQFSVSVARLAGRAGPGVQGAAGCSHCGRRAHHCLPGCLRGGRGSAHRSSRPRRGQGQVPAPLCVQSGWAGAWRRVGTAAGRTWPGRATHRSPAAASGGRHLDLGRRRRPRSGSTRGTQGSAADSGRALPYLRGPRTRRGSPGPRLKWQLSCGPRW
jgi:hypothetical protein